MCLRFLTNCSKGIETTRVLEILEGSQTPKKVYGGSTGKHQGIQMSEDRRTVFKDLRNPLRGWSFFY